MFPTGCFKQLVQLQQKERKKILVHTENGVAASKKKHIGIVTNHFKEMFQKVCLVLVCT